MKCDIPAVNPLSGEPASVSLALPPPHLESGGTFYSNNTTTTHIRSGAHGGLFSHAGAFCPVHQCPNSSEATSWETAWETPQCPRRAAQRPPALGRPNVGVWARLARHRVRRARFRGRRYRRCIRFWIGLPRAHQRLQLLRMGVRWMRGVFDGKGPLAPPLLATTPYDCC